MHFAFDIRKYDQTVYIRLIYLQIIALANDLIFYTHFTNLIFNVLIAILLAIYRNYL